MAAHSLALSFSFAPTPLGYLDFFFSPAHRIITQNCTETAPRLRSQPPPSLAARRSDSPRDWPWASVRDSISWVEVYVGQCVAMPPPPFCLPRLPSPPPASRRSCVNWPPSKFETRERERVRERLEARKRRDGEGVGGMKRGG